MVNEAAAADPLTEALFSERPRLGAPQEGAADDLARLVAILRRRVPTIVTTVVLALSAAGAYLAVESPTYKATGQVLLDARPLKIIAGESSQDAYSGDALNEMLESQLLVIVSQNVLIRAISAEGPRAAPVSADSGLMTRATLWASSWISGASAQDANWEAHALRALKKQVVAKRMMPKGLVIEIAAEAKDRDTAARLANAVADSYLVERRSAKAAEAAQAAEALASRLPDLAGDVRQAEDALDRYRFQNNITASAVAAATLATNSAMIGLHELERKLDATRAVYQAFLTRSREMSEESKLGQPNARIIARAEPPADPVWPRPGLMLGLALVGGAVFGAGLGLARDWADDRLYSRRQIEETTPFKVNAVVPRFRPMPPDLPRSAQRAFFRLSDALRFGSSGRPHRFVMVTSFRIGEGKSVVASGLAAAFATEGERVLLLDGHNATRVISRAINSSLAPERPAGKQGSPALQNEVLPELALPPKEDIRGICAHVERLRQAVERQEMFDFVIFDCGSVALERRARYIAELADAIVVVTRAGRTTLRDLEELRHDLGGTVGRVSGIVLNGADG